MMYITSKTSGYSVVVKVQGVKEEEIPTSILWNMNNGSTTTFGLEQRTSFSNWVVYMILIYWRHSQRTHSDEGLVKTWAKEVTCLLPRQATDYYPSNPQIIMVSLPCDRRRWLQRLSWPVQVQAQSLHTEGTNYENHCVVLNPAICLLPILNT